VELQLGAVNPGTVEVQLYADPVLDKPYEVHVMTRVRVVDAPTNTYLYEASIETIRPPKDFTPRAIPALSGAMVPLEAPQVLWYS
jgi:glycogen phosphorylase